MYEVIICEDESESCVNPLTPTVGIWVYSYKAFCDSQPGLNRHL